MPVVLQLLHAGCVESAYRLLNTSASAHRQFALHLADIDNAAESLNAIDIFNIIDESSVTALLQTKPMLLSTIESIPSSQLGSILRFHRGEKLDVEPRTTICCCVFLYTQEYISFALFQIALPPPKSHRHRLGGFGVDVSHIDINIEQQEHEQRMVDNANARRQRQRQLRQRQQFDRERRQRREQAASDAIATTRRLDKQLNRIRQRYATQLAVAEPPMKIVVEQCMNAEIEVRSC